jgi:hypothetical protein
MLTISYVFPIQKRILRVMVPKVLANIGVYVPDKKPSHHTRKLLEVDLS